MADGFVSCKVIDLTESFFDAIACADASVEARQLVVMSSFI